MAHEWHELDFDRQQGLRKRRCYTCGTEQYLSNDRVDGKIIYQWWPLAGRCLTEAKKEIEKQ